MTSNIAGLLTYVPFVGWIFAIVFIVLPPFRDDKFVRFHAFQSLFLSIAVLVLYYVFYATSPQFGTASLIAWIAGMLVGILLGPVYWLAVLALWLMLMYHAHANKKFKLPVIGNIAARLAGQ